MRIKKLFAAVIILFVAMNPANIRVFAVVPEVSASSAVLTVLQTGEVLFEKNAGRRRSMASTTKIMTSLIALKQGTPDRIVTVTADMLAEGTSSGLAPGNKISIINLVRCMLLQSGNDAANAAACAVAGSTEKFVRLMNAEAKRLGMKDTHFVTPSGLDAEGHYTTAYDMAVLAAWAIEFPDFQSVCSLKKSEICFAYPEKKITAYNHNRLLNEVEGAVGVKTGFTKKSGRCLVSAATRDGVTLIAVTLNAPDDWNDHKKLLEYGFSSVKRKTAPQPALPTLKVTGGTEASVPVRAGCKSEYAELETGKITSKIRMRRFEYAPVHAGDTVGSIEYYRNGVLTDTVALLADGESAVSKPENNKRLTDFFKRFLHE